MGLAQEQVNNKDRSMSSEPAHPHQSDPFSVLRFHGWEVDFECNRLAISSDAGFRVIVKDVSPTRAKVRVPSSDSIEILVHPFPIEMHIRDESVRDWLIRFLHYWGFRLEGVKVECGVIVVDSNDASPVNNDAAMNLE